MKSITVRDKENKSYVLTFTAETVRMLEARGFVQDKLFEQPMTYIPMLFEGAFLAKEAGNVDPDKIMDIYKGLKDKTALVRKLLELYNEPINEVIIKEGNAEWECNF